MRSTGFLYSPYLMLYSFIRRTLLDQAQDPSSPASCISLAQQTFPGAHIMARDLYSVATLLHLAFRGSPFLKPGGCIYPYWLVTCDILVLISYPRCHFKDIYDVSFHYGKEFHRLITYWVKKYFLLSVLTLPLHNFSEGLLVWVSYERDKNIPLPMPC